MVSDPAGEKRALRAELRERRRIRPLAERESATAEMTRHLIAVTTSVGATSIACYLSTPDEPETRPFLAWTAENGIEVLLPISRDDGLLDWAPYTASDEGSDVIGMPVPTSDIVAPIAINDVGLIIVPAAAVDHTGMRMGWGRGYFDRTLGSMDSRPPVFAVLFDDEVVDELPRERHDQPVDGVVTPSGVRHF